MKNPVTPAGIEPATFRFVAQHLNHCATAVPQPHIVQHVKNNRRFPTYHYSHNAMIQTLIQKRTKKLSKYEDL